jgi:hypothetical protein
MDNSSYAQPLPEESWTRAASGHQEGFRVVEGRWHVYPEMAAAGLWTTAADLAKVLIDMQHAYLGAPALLSELAAREMLTPQVETRIDFRIGGGTYGLGFHLEEPEYAQRFGHAGLDAGFFAEMTAYRDEGKGIVVLTNMTHSPFTRDVMEAVARVCHWPSYREPRRRELAGSRTREAEFAGDYEVRPGYIYRVEQSETGLVLHIPAQEPLPMTAFHESGYMLQATETELTFRTRSDGMVVGVDLWQDGTSSFAPRAR